MASTLPSASDCCTPCAHALTVTIVQTGGGGGSGDALVFDTTEDLRAYGSFGTNRYAIVLGNLVPGDGEGRQFFWDEVGTDPDNGASVVRPDDFAGAGLWRQWV